jgi:DNA-binding GntR family transcriptional regulator
MTKNKVAKAEKESRSIRERAYVHIQAKIAARELPAGSAISDIAIADEMGSSRTPVREALRQLLTEGFLSQTANGGLVVVRLTRQDISELFEMREALEVHACRKVALRGLPAPDLIRSQELLNEMIAIHSRLLRSGKPGLEPEEMHRYETFDVAFHTVLIRAADNLRLLKTVNEVRQLIGTFTMRHKGHGAAELAILNEQHKNLLDAIIQQNPDRATGILTEHSKNSERVRIEEYAQWERESSLRESVPEVLLFEGTPTRPTSMRAQE